MWPANRSGTLRPSTGGNERNEKGEKEAKERKKRGMDALIQLLPSPHTRSFRDPDDEDSVCSRGAGEGEWGVRRRVDCSPIVGLGCLSSAGDHSFSASAFPLSFLPPIDSLVRCADRQHVHRNGSLRERAIEGTNRCALARHCAQVPPADQRIPLLSVLLHILARPSLTPSLAHVLTPSPPSSIPLTSGIVPFTLFPAIARDAAYHSRSHESAF